MCMCVRVAMAARCVGTMWQNLGTPMTAVTDIPRGSIVSLSSNGGAMKGFGMQVTSALATGGLTTNPIVLNMTGTVVVMLYNDTSAYGQAVYYDTTASSVGVGVGLCVLLSPNVCRCVCMCAARFFFWGGGGGGGGWGPGPGAVL